MEMNIRGRGSAFLKATSFTEEIYHIVQKPASSTDNLPLLGPPVQETSVVLSLLLEYMVLVQGLKPQSHHHAQCYSEPISFAASSLTPLCVVPKAPSILLLTVC